MENLFPVKRTGGNVKGAGSRLIWTEEQINFIQRHYNEHHNVKMLSKICKVSQQTMRGTLKKAGVDIILTSEKGKHLRPRNSNYFETIDSPDKAYWLGFLYADGCNYKKRNNLRINLQVDDVLHLQKFLNAIGAINHKIFYQSKNMNGKRFTTAFISVTDKKMCQDLEDKGCVERKSLILRFPNESQVPSALLSHFLRGYFDGDGSIYTYILKTTNKLKYGMSFIGTYDFLEGVKMFLNKTNLKLECKGSFYCLHISGNKQIYNSLSLLYKDSEKNIELPRKRKKFEMLTLQRIGGEPVNTGCA